MAAKKSRTRIIIGSIIVLVVLLVIARKSGWIGEPEGIKVTSGTVTRETITETVSASGKVQPEVEVKIAADVSGEVVELHVKEGDVVEKGALLAKINPQIYMSARDRVAASVNTAQANLESSRSRLRQAQAQFNNTEQIYNRNKKLFDEKVISLADFESVKSSYEVSRAELDAAAQAVAAAEYGVRSAEASLKEADENLNKTSIFAPVTGTVSKLSVEKGERVVGTEMMAGTEVIRLANLNEMEVNVDVSETDIIRVQVGDTAWVDIDAYLNRKFRGVVTEIANSANNTTGLTTDQVTNFAVKVRVLRDSYTDLIPADKPTYSPFRPGMSATVEIVTNRVEQAVSVPIQAVTTRDTTLRKSSKEVARRRQGDAEAPAESAETAAAPKAKRDEVSECVFVIDNGKAILRAVKTGIQDNMNIQILEGLKEGETVITAPFNAISSLLHTGDKVRVVPKEELFTRK